MHLRFSLSRSGLIIALAAVAVLPARLIAQDVSGQAAAVRATVLGVTTSLADTGWLAGATDARGAGSLTGSLPLVGSAESLHATAVPSVNGDATDTISSAASVANLVFTIAGQVIRADFVMSEANAFASGAPQAGSIVSGLTVNGVPISVSGAQNQAVSLPGLSFIINEVSTASGGTTVNALHISSLDGLVDVVVATATAGLGAGSGGSGGILPPLGL